MLVLIPFSTADFIARYAHRFQGCHVELEPRRLDLEFDCFVFYFNSLILIYQNITQTLPYFSGIFLSLEVFVDAILCHLVQFSRVFEFTFFLSTASFDIFSIWLKMV